MVSMPAVLRQGLTVAQAWLERTATLLSARLQIYTPHLGKNRLLEAC